MLSKKCREAAPVKLNPASASFTGNCWAIVNLLILFGVPDGIRTRVIAVKGHFRQLCCCLHGLARASLNPSIYAAYPAYHPCTTLQLFDAVLLFHRDHIVTSLSAPLPYQLQRRKDRIQSLDRSR